MGLLCLVIGIAAAGFGGCRQSGLDPTEVVAISHPYPAVEMRSEPDLLQRLSLHYGAPAGAQELARIELDFHNGVIAATRNAGCSPYARDRESAPFLGMWQEEIRRIVDELEVGRFCGNKYDEGAGSDGWAVSFTLTWRDAGSCTFVNYSHAGDWQLSALELAVIGVAAASVLP